MISRLAFSRLRHGDVVIWKVWPNAYFRTVIEGPVDIAKSRGDNAPLEHMHVVFAIRRRSWTNRARTSYGWNDVKRLISLPRKPRRSRTMINAEERDHLRHIGFDPAKERRREIHESLKANKRMKRICPFKPAPLP